MTLPTDQPPTAATNVQPIPPRFWWLKRILVLAGVVLTALICLRLWWGHVAHTRLQAEIDRIRAAGEPIYPEDFDTEPIPDKDNAAVYLKKAENAITYPDDVELTIDDIRADPQLLVTHADQVARIIDANEKALHLLRKARSASSVDWEVRPRSPLIDFALPSLSGQRQLPKLACVAARYHHQLGNDSAAVDTLRDVVSASADLEHPGVFLIGHMVAIANSEIAAGAIEDIAPTLAIVNAGVRSAEADQPANRDQVEALITDLLNEQRVRDGLLWALYGERATHLDLVRMTIHGEMSTIGVGMGTPIIFPIKPMIELDAIRMMQFMSALVDGAREPTWPRSLSKFPAMPGSSTGISTLATLFSRILLPSLDRVILLDYHTLAVRRMAAVALGIRMYAVDHGQRPDTLHELVPDYLPAIPSDPFATKDVVFGYLPRALQPVLYSVASNGIDEHGAFQLTQWGSVDWEASDMPFFLDGDRPRCPSDVATASVQTDEDKGDVEEGQRDADQNQTADENP